MWLAAISVRCAAPASMAGVAAVAPKLHTDAERGLLNKLHRVGTPAMWVSISEIEVTC
jgi:hypothetical protein